MRQALNNLQSTANGFGEISSENVFKVCDEPHPILVKEMLMNCVDGEMQQAYKVQGLYLEFAHILSLRLFSLQVVAHLWKLGYAGEDIIANIFRVCKNLDIDENLKLAFIKVFL